jgi:CRISPR/Cas system CMR-associated protein Cmr1 (group 7 of RAMP superfamily)
MAEFTQLDEKLAEVIGLAQAAQQSTKKVAQLAKKEKDNDLVSLMQRMTEEAITTEKSAREIADGRSGLKTQIRNKARETKSDVVDFMRGYLEGADSLDGLEFLSMTEAGELAHWEILAALNEKAGDKQIRKVVDKCLPLQRGHVENVRESSLRVASEEDPLQPV